MKLGSRTESKVLALWQFMLDDRLERQQTGRLDFASDLKSRQAVSKVPARQECGEFGALPDG